MSTTNTLKHRAGFVGIVGEPNAGKSTLLNRFLDERLAIVTAKPQTTRKRQTGILNLPQGQIVFLDAPGFIKADKGLNEFLMKEAKKVSSEADLLLVAIALDTDRKDKVEKVLKTVAGINCKKIIIITKMDQEKLLPRREAIKQLAMAALPGVEILEVSNNSSKQDLAEILEKILAQLPETEGSIVDQDILCLEAERDLVAEQIREQCLEHLHQEIPYKLAVQIRTFNDTEKLVHIDADVVVGRNSHKSIVVGKKAEMIKKIGMLSRKRIEKFLGKQVMLKLQVVVREDWEFNPRFMKELGYSIEEKS